MVQYAQTMHFGSAGSPIGYVTPDSYNTLQPEDIVVCVDKLGLFSYCTICDVDWGVLHSASLENVCCFLTRVLQVDTVFVTQRAWNHAPEEERNSLSDKLRDNLVVFPIRMHIVSRAKQKKRT